MTKNTAQTLDIKASEAAYVIDIAGLHRRHLPDQLFVTPARFAHLGAERWHEYKRHRQRSDKRRDQRDRQEFHKLADDTRPKQQGKEGGKRSRGRSDDRPGHPLGGLRICFGTRRPFDHFPVGVFGNDYGAVDKQADRQN